MTNRRELLRAAAALAPGIGGLLDAADAKAEVAGPFYAFVYDERFAPGRALARQASGRGQRIRAIRGDVTQLWYDDLYHQWRQGPAALYGLTTAQSLFCLETLGADVGLRRARGGFHALSQTIEGAPLLTWALTPTVM